MGCRRVREDDDSVGENTNNKPKDTRARNLLSKVTRQRDKNMKFKLKWNTNGEAIGPFRANYKSYLGISTRHRVNINFQRWDQVPDHIKDAIYVDVSGVFDVPESKRKQLLSTAGSMFRDFKKKLAGRFRYSDAAKTKLNPHPPSSYSFISQQMWDAFVDYRQSDEFKEKSEKNQKAAHENDHTYRASRKGYAGLEEEMIFEVQSQVANSEDATRIKIPRDKLWLEARKDKNGIMDDSVQQVAAEMEEIFEWIFQEEIQATHVSIYIGYLLDNYQERDVLSQFRFLCPHKVAEIPLVIPSKKEAEVLAEKREDQARYIAQATKSAKANQMFLAPYHSKNHWMLCVIHPSKQVVFWLDPLGGPVRTGIKNIIELSIKIKNAQCNSNRSNKSTRWVEIKCPRQTNNVDCGYCILRFIQDIISRGSHSIPEKYYPEFGGSRPYAKENIDEIRDQWATYVQGFIE